MHKHEWKTKHAGIVAEYQKGSRGKVLARGNYQECKWCPLGSPGRFVPELPQLTIVPCEYTKKFIAKEIKK